MEPIFKKWKFKHGDKIVAIYLGKEGSRMEGTLDFDSLDIGANF